jgi:hypothetical protein
MWRELPVDGAAELVHDGLTYPSPDDVDLD